LRGIALDGSRATDVNGPPVRQARDGRTVAPGKDDMRFDLTDLKLFLHVVEGRSITIGAERMNVALATASTRIRNMELAIGAQLLQRLQRGVQPTAAGQSLIHHARLILQQVEDMNLELQDHPRHPNKVVRVLANTAAASEFLPDIFGTFLAAHDQIDIDLGERPSNEIVQAVVGGLVDIGIMSDAADSHELEPHLLSFDPLVLVVPDGHALAERPEIDFRTAADEPFIGLTPDRALQDYLCKHALRNGHGLNYRIFLRTFDDVCRLVARGVGVAIVSEAAADRCRARMPISVVPLVDRWANRNLLFCVRRLNLMPPHVRSLIEHLRLAAAELRSRRPAGEPRRVGWAGMAAGGQTP